MKSIRKTDLPTKTCPTCGRPFAWRKKWRANWESVVYCSDGCRKHKNTPRPGVQEAN